MRIAHWLAVLLLLVSSATALAQAPPPATPEQRQAEQEAAWAAAVAAATRGPADVALLDQAVLHLPARMMFIPAAESRRMLEASGNRPGANLVGLVTAFGDDTQWFVVVTFTKEGYVRDDEAGSLDANEVLSQLREGQAEANRERTQRGFPALELLGWATPPAYDAATHRLVWSLRVGNVGAPAGDVSANYNTRALGREGYFSLNLVTDEQDLERDRPAAAALLAGLGYRDGKRYQDFNVSTDRVAEYGLVALLGVVAAKKLGLLAAAGLLLLKFGKVLAIAGAAVTALVARVFRRRPNA